MSATKTENARKGFDTGFADALAEGNAWFPQLPMAKQAEVLRYAVLHIASNSSLFERNNSNHHVYEWLTIAIARSGLTDADPRTFTLGSANIRPLGVSETVRVYNRSFITLTGNNPIITGDMARRTLPIDILPRSADPERDRYSFNPADYVQHRRPVFLRAAFTAMRAFRLAGIPRHGLPAVGSFDDWSRKVRDLVFWLTSYDVSEGFRRNKAEDPRRQGDAALLAALYQHFGTTPFKGADVITVHKRVIDHQRTPHSSPAPTLMEQAVHEALESVLSSRNINAKIFGYWALRVKGARMEGFMLETHHNTTTNANDITIQKV